MEYLSPAWLNLEIEIYHIINIYNQNSFYNIQSSYWDEFLAFNILYNLKNTMKNIVRNLGHKVLIIRLLSFEF